IDLVVHISRLPGGRRVVTQISEITGVDPRTGDVQVTDIFNFRNGESLQPTGYLPSFIDSLISKGLLELEFLYGAPEAPQLQLPAAPAMARVAAPLPRSTAPSGPPALPSPQAAPDGWYCEVMGTELGPMTHEDLVQMVRSGQLTPEDRVRHAATEWYPAPALGLF